MRITPTQNQNFKGSALISPLSTFYDANAVIPTLIIESGVTLGRTNQAQKRGGNIEALERFIEQGVSALVWVFGVQAFQKTGEFIGKNLFKDKLKTDNFNFDVGSDCLRNPIENNNISKAASNFKAGNILVSTALATVFIGFVLPKINNVIVRKLLNKPKGNQKPDTLLNSNDLSFEKFKNDTDKKPSNTSFKGRLVNAANLLENNSNARLLITDAGVVSGRCYNAKNKYKKIEGIFRDVASIYFYLKAPSDIAKLVNIPLKNADVNPKALDVTAEKLKKMLGSSKMDAKSFKEAAIGSVDKSQLSKLDELFKGKQTVTLEEFLAAFLDASKTKAKDMTDLQPVFNEYRVLSKAQAKDVLSTGWLSDPKFLREAMNKATKEASDNPMKFVSKESLETIRGSLDKFILQVENYAIDKGVQVDATLIEKVAKSNVLKNFVSRSIGIAGAIYALGFLIPKVQYAITRKLTNKNEYPGLDEYK